MHPVAALQALLVDELLRADDVCSRLRTAGRVREAAQALAGRGLSAGEDEAVGAWLAVTLPRLEVGRT